MKRGKCFPLWFFSALQGRVQRYAEIPTSHICSSCMGHAPYWGGRCGGLYLKLSRHQNNPSSHLEMVPSLRCRLSRARETVKDGRTTQNEMSILTSMKDVWWNRRAQWRALWHLLENCKQRAFNWKSCFCNFCWAAGIRHVASPGKICHFLWDTESIKWG